VSQATQLQRADLPEPPLSGPLAVSATPPGVRRPLFLTSGTRNTEANPDDLYDRERDTCSVGRYNLDAISSVCHEVPSVVRRIEGMNVRYVYSALVGAALQLIPKLKTRRGALNAAPGSFRA